MRRSGPPECLRREASRTASRRWFSYNRKRGTLRGMHRQAAPHAQAKVVRCTRGSIHDVIIDLRTESATFGRWIAVNLSAASATMLYVPEGFAHGFQTLDDDTDVS